MQQFSADPVLDHGPALPGVEEAVRFDVVGLRYGNGPEVISDISMMLPRGSFQFLTGPSGAGKTSLLSLLYLARRPSRGVVTLFGHDVSNAPRAALPALRRRLGVVFQDFRLLDHLSAFDNVALPLRVGGMPEAEARRRVRELMDWVGLAEQMQARPPMLSGGQQQRVAIARAVINRPELLIADEPTGNVDDRTAMRLMHLFSEMNRLGTTVVIATHNESLVRRLRRPRLHLDDGRLTYVPAPPPSAPAEADGETDPDSGEDPA